MQRTTVYSVSKPGVTLQAGSLACLHYAHEHGCPWDEHTCEYAAEIGALDCLSYAHEHGCPWDVNTVAAAANKEVLSALPIFTERAALWIGRNLWGTLLKVEVCLA